ncbi:MAG: DUF1540 domain-containing protein [Firmicutes bacterium]|jgi:hypothetical protein|nr:DUF1540 domain-containing protein [Bacillota bacterium]HQD39839.1 DUF1540 domain-containing protein [Bacillota bacterium]
MAKINCSVRSCYYWNEGGICGADSIIVKNNRPGDLDDELASLDMELGSIGEFHANTSAETCCETFRPREE